MKRARRGAITVKEFVDRIHTVRCPHCKTFLKGGINRNIDRLFCYHCGNVIILDWENLREQNNG